MQTWMILLYENHNIYSYIQSDIFNSKVKSSLTLIIKKKKGNVD